MYAIMDNTGIIETFEYEDEARGSIERIRNENNIDGDILLIKMIGCFN